MAFKFQATGQTVTTGSIQSGDYTDTWTQGGAWVVRRVGGILDVELLTNIGDTSTNRDLNGLTFEAQLHSQSSGVVELHIYDYVAAGWHVTGEQFTPSTFSQIVLFGPDDISQDWVDTTGAMRLRFYSSSGSNNRDFSIILFDGDSVNAGESAVTAAEIAQLTAKLISQDHGYGSYRSADEVNGTIVDVPTTNQYTMSSGTEDDDIYNGNLARFEQISIPAVTTFDPGIDSADLNFSNGNLTATNNGTSVYAHATSTSGKDSGRWYIEFHFVTAVGSFTGLGIAHAGYSTSVDLGQNADSWSYFTNGNRYIEGSYGAYGDTWTSGDVMGAVLDLDASTIEFFKNDVSQGQFAVAPDVAKNPYNAVAQVYNSGDQVTIRATATDQQYSAAAKSALAWDDVGSVGTLRIGYGFITDYVGPTKTITIDPGLSVLPFIPQAGDFIRVINWSVNALAIANQPAVETLFNTPLTESYAAQGTPPTLAQMLYMLLSHHDKNINGVTVTARRIDGTTTAMTYTLDDANNPLDQNRTS